MSSDVVREPRCKQRFDEEQIEFIVTNYVAGATMRWLADELDCSISPIRRVLHEQEILLRTRGQTLSVVVEDGKKRCTACLEWKLLEEFYVETKRPSGRTSRCKRCTDEDQDKYYWVKLVKKFGLSPAAYMSLLTSQGGTCAICKRIAGVGRSGKPCRLCVDHDHKTGRVRGLLCSLCNKMIGQSGDDPELLEKGAAYLRLNQEKTNEPEPKQPDRGPDKPRKDHVPKPGKAKAGKAR